ncbi:hypothetical protein [Umezawaea sp. NPDC059074]|uniref:hypothetical protein n=1 Tax=Umezawaea sp. NPDC059074 TaxID=3346716 RepID=UPI0036833B14
MSDAVLACFPVFRNAGPPKCGETAVNSTHAGDVRISRAGVFARARKNNKGGL